MAIQEPAISDQRAWLSLSESARILGCSAGKVRQLVDRGALDSLRSPLGRLVEARSLYEYLAWRDNARSRGRLPRSRNPFPTTNRVPEDAA